MTKPQDTHATPSTQPTPGGHTPGPWAKIRGELVGSNGKKVVEYSSGVAIMCGGGADPESVANTNLRNAAPDLLEALQECRAKLSGFVGACAEMTDCGPDVEALKRADAAIAKALIRKLALALVEAKRSMWIDARATWTMTDFTNWAVVQQMNEALAEARSVLDGPESGQ